MRWSTGSRRSPSPSSNGVSPRAADIDGTDGMEMTLSPEVQRRVEEMVRPLYAGLDGVQTFDRVDRLRRQLAALGTMPEGGDADLLELLLLLHGVVDRLGSLASGGRLDLFLRGL